MTFEELKTEADRQGYNLIKKCQLNNEVKFKTNNKDLSRKVLEAEELARKILRTKVEK